MLQIQRERCQETALLLLSSQQQQQQQEQQIAALRRCCRCYCRVVAAAERAALAPLVHAVSP